jgi:hypothetical protein
VIVPVMQVRRVRMRVPQRFVHVRAGMGLRALVAAVRVPVVLVMDVAMAVGHALVGVAVGMALGQSPSPLPR